MKNSLISLVIFIFLFMSYNSKAQTFLSPNFGFNINYYEYIDPGANSMIVDLHDRNSLNIGFEFDHFINNNFDLKIGGSYSLRKYSYRFESFGINPFYVNSYKYGNFYMSSGYNIVDWLNLGIGFKKIIFYNFEYIWVGGIEKKSEFSNFNALHFHIKFLYKNLFLILNYNKSINSSQGTLIFDNFDMFEIKAGYRLKIR